MGLISNLCTDLGVAPETLARIVGLPAERVARWAVGGVPPHHHIDFRPLEEVVEMVREWPMKPVRNTVRLGLPALSGASILQMLEEHGAVFVLERLRVDVHAQSPAAGAPTPVAG